MANDASIKHMIIKSTNNSDGYQISAKYYPLMIIPFADSILHQCRITEFYYLDDVNLYKFKIWDFDLNNNLFSAPDEISVMMVYIDR